MPRPLPTPPGSGADGISVLLTLRIWPPPDRTDPQHPSPTTGGSDLAWPEGHSLVRDHHALAGRQRIGPANLVKPREVRVSGTDLQAMLDRKGRQMGVGDKDAARLIGPYQLRHDVSVARGRRRDP